MKDYFKLADIELTAWEDATGMPAPSEAMRQEQVRILADILREELEEADKDDA